MWNDFAISLYLSRPFILYGSVVSSLHKLFPLRSVPDIVFSNIAYFHVSSQHICLGEATLHQNKIYNKLIQVTLYVILSKYPILGMTCIQLALHYKCHWFCMQPGRGETMRYPSSWKAHHSNALHIVNSHNLLTSNDRIYLLAAYLWWYLNCKRFILFKYLARVSCPLMFKFIIIHLLCMNEFVLWNPGWWIQNL